VVKALLAAGLAMAWVGSLAGCELVVDDGRRVLAGDGGDAATDGGGTAPGCDSGCLSQSTTCQQTCAAMEAACVAACHDPAPPPCLDLCTQQATGCASGCSNQCVACFAQMGCAGSKGCSD
jgi:hypothetical protein